MHCQQSDLFSISSLNVPEVCLLDGSSHPRIKVYQQIYKISADEEVLVILSEMFLKSSKKKTYNKRLT